jgi:hypothetical protein
VLIPTARTAPRIAQRIGFRWVGPAGLLSMSIGFFLLSRLEVDTPYWFFLIGLLFFGFGMGLAGTPATTALTSALPMAKQGVASAMNDTAREVGSAFGIAILGAALDQSYRSALAPAVADLPPEIAERALGSVAFTASPALGRLGPAGQSLMEAGRAAFVQGVGDAVLIGCVVLAAAAVIVFVASGPRAQTAVEMDDALAAA